MAFVVETGLIVPSANAYIDVAFADSYHDDRGHDSWGAFDTTKKQKCIVRATDYVDKRFSRRYRGRLVIASAQVLQWPRLGVFTNEKQLLVNSNAIPLQLKQAVAEYALRAGLLGELAPDPIANVPRMDLGVASPVLATEFVGGQVRRIGKKVDVIETTKTFQTPDQSVGVNRNKQGTSSLVSDATIPEYPAADLLLEILLRNGERRLRRGD